MKQTKNSFICDECGKESKDCVDGTINAYPYDNKWVYLHSMQFKLSQDKILTIKDKHFCSYDCMIKFLIKKIEGVAKK